jgi:hypothetical protein
MLFSATSNGSSAPRSDAYVVHRPPFHHNLGYHDSPSEGFLGRILVALPECGWLDRRHRLPRCGKADAAALAGRLLEVGARRVQARREREEVHVFVHGLRHARRRVYEHGGTCGVYGL